MSTAIAYSFMTMDNNNARNNTEPISPRRSNSNDRNSRNFSFDNISEGGTMSKTGSGKRRPRKRSASGSRSNKPPKVNIYYSRTSMARTLMTRSTRMTRPYGFVYEICVVKFLHLYFHAVNFIFY